MTLPGPSCQECTGYCHENVPALKAVSYVCDVDRWSDCIGYRIEIVCLIGTLSTILQHFTHTMKPSDPLLLIESVHLCCLCL